MIYQLHMSHILFMSLLLSWQIPTTLDDAQQVAYSNAELGFNYVPPSRMRDSTKQSIQDLRARAANADTRNTLTLLLSMTSGPDDTATAWHSLVVEIYPRVLLSDLDDIGAELRMNTGVAGRHGLGSPKILTFGNCTFTLQEFDQQDRDVRKYASIYTTVRRGELLSFAFTANSPEQLKILKESMKTLSFH